MKSSASYGILRRVAGPGCDDDSYQATTTAHDGCVVERQDLAAIVGGFVTTWRKRHPVGNDPAQRGLSRRRETEVGALNWLQAEIARREPNGPPVTREMLNNILRADSPKRAAKRYVDLRYADSIVSAIGDVDAFRDGRLPIRPNPRARRSLQASCCRGVGFQDALDGLVPHLPQSRDLARSYRAGYREAALVGAAQLRASQPPARL